MKASRTRVNLKNRYRGLAGQSLLGQFQDTVFYDEMKKFLLACLILLVILALYFYFNPEEVPEIPLVGDLLGEKQDRTVIYRWQDRNGEWHYSNSRPTEGTPYEEIEYTHDTNLLPSLKNSPEGK